MDKAEKERVVAELVTKLRQSDTLIVTDYRGLTMPQIDQLRARLIEHGARFSVVKNTLTRRAASEAGIGALLAMLEGPSAIAFISSEGDMVEAARALSDAARETRVLVIRGGLMQGRTISGSEVEELAKLPPFDVLRGQVLGAIAAPLSGLAGLLHAALQTLVGLIDARIDQLGGAGAEETAAPADSSEPASAEAAGEEPQEGEAAGEVEATPAARAVSEADEVSAPEAGEPAVEAAEPVVAESENELEAQPEADDQEVDDGGG